MFKTVKFLLLSCLFTFSVLANAQTIDEIKQLAEQGDAMGQAKLASLYFLGKEEIEVDHKLAAQWMKKAAKQGLVEAQATIAAMYDTGKGVQYDRNKASQWYEKAAKQGHGTSMAILGKNPTAKGSVHYSYQSMRLNASKSIPREYSKRFLKKK